MPRHPVTCFDTPLTVPSPYYFGEDILAEFPTILSQYDFDRCFLVTSRKLFPLFGRTFLDVLRQAHVPCESIAINETERHKNWKTLRDLCEALVAGGATKDSILIALGGGVVGNLVGLAAALLYRGVRFVQVPTTIMSQSDSTLSNKQAINGQRGKNHFGVYHAPLLIWSDTAYVAAEPERQRRSGVVEGIKNIFISNRDTEAANDMVATWESGEKCYELVRMLIQSKLQILRQDHSERGYGVILEYGHTFGHAIEWLAQGQLYHGEAVAIGMCLAAEVSRALGYMSKDFVKEHYHMLEQRLGAPTRLPKEISLAQLYETMLNDNKRSKKGLGLLLLRRCGEFVKSNGDYLVSVPQEALLLALKSIRQDSLPIMMRA